MCMETHSNLDIDFSRLGCIIHIQFITNTPHAFYQVLQLVRIYWQYDCILWGNGIQIIIILSYGVVSLVNIVM